MVQKTRELKGEGNREADRNYRQDVRKTVKNTTAQERAEKARDIDLEQLKELREAEEKGKEPARS